jgi:predicted O-linked N-acetylglucosamine transferase (SPINDLY family)
MHWNPEAHTHLLSRQYDEVVSIYEQQVEDNPDDISSYWYLGLAYLLAKREEEAQTAWFFGVAQAEVVETNQSSSDHIAELVNILSTEAIRQQELSNNEIAWLLCQHCKEIDPANLNNLLRLVDLAIESQSFEPSLLEDLQLVKVLNENGYSSVHREKILNLLEKLFEYPSQELVKVCEYCLISTDTPKDWIQPLLAIANRVGDHLDFPMCAANLLELCIKVDPDNIEILKRLCHFSIYSSRYKRAIEIAKKYYKLSESFADQFLSNYQLFASLTRAGAWSDIPSVAEKNKALLQQIFEDSQPLSDAIRPYVITAASLLAYTQDDIVNNRYFQNNTGNLFTKKHEGNIIPRRKSVSILDESKKIKIGYIGSTLRAHSVGWLCRWIFQYHNRERFHISTYLVNQILEDKFYAQWFHEKVDSSQIFELDPYKIANKINEDEIDILIDLDSITLNITYEVMSLKPAPIQVTWLGWDASGLSSIDYFIADPYVLPQDAQSHYQETIWRLPQTYVAVDGFEVGTPELTKQDLNIPNDAVVFFSSQAGSKRHPSTIRLQLKVLKEVPGSYFLIKAIGDTEAVKEIFTSLAEQEGVSSDRLRFIDFAKSEYVHRANLQLVDVVLDTYPYNGATTTLETLWMGIPLVTRVGSTFSARNSYTFMMNVGVTEGIAWTDAEYVDWGIRLGRDERLRQQVNQKLRKSRQSSPLWNAKQFTLEMENAYHQMWKYYLARQ